MKNKEKTVREAFAELSLVIRGLTAYTILLGAMYVLMWLGFPTFAQCVGVLLERFTYDQRHGDGQSEITALADFLIKYMNRKHEQERTKKNEISNENAN